MKQPLRIAIVTSDIPNYRIPFFRELARQGVEAHVIAAGNLGKGFVMDALPAEVAMKRLRPSRFPRFRTDVVRTILEIAPHAIVSEHAARRDYVWTTLASPTLRRFPRVLWTHGVARQELYGGMRGAASYGRWIQIDLADAVLCYEANGASLVRAARPGKKVGYINNSTDGFELRAQLALLEKEGRLAVRERLGIRAGSDVICGLGRLVPEKEFSRLVPVLANIRNAGMDAQLVVIGDGPERVAIERIAVEANVREHVVFAGAVRGAAELAPWLYASDVSVSPAAIGLSVTDALFAGLPTVTPAPGRDGPFHGPEFQYLTPGKTALITTGNSDHSLAAACAQYFSLDSRARDTMINACVQFAVESLGVARMASAMVDFLTETRRTWDQDR